MIRNNIKSVVDMLGYGVAEAADKCGIHRVLMSRLYNNRTTRIDLETLNALCRGLDAEVSDLFEYIPD